MPVDIKDLQVHIPTFGKFTYLGSINLLISHGCQLLYFGFFLNNYVIISYLFSNLFGMHTVCECMCKSKL